MPQPSGHNRSADGEQAAHTRTHPQLKELILTNFASLGDHAGKLVGYDACFFCAGVSSVGKNEDTFNKLTYDVVVPFAKTLSSVAPGMVFTYVSGSGTDSTERGRVMWARVKGKTENALLALPFKAAYNFRPGFMKAVRGQRNLPVLYRAFAWLYPVLKTALPAFACTMEEVGLAMIECAKDGYAAHTIEVKDIRVLAQRARATIGGNGKM